MSSMLAIENNRENHSILNQIYDIPTKLHNQGKHFTLCKVPAHIGIKRSEEADRVEKQAIDMTGMTISIWGILPAWQEAPNGKCNLKRVLVNYTTLNLTFKSGKVPTTVVGNIRLSKLHIGHTWLTY